MSERKISTAAWLAVLCLMPAATMAQMPREGAWEWTHCFGGPVHTTIATPELTAGTYVVTGVSRSAGGPVETMSLECSGTFEYRSGKAGSQGYCVHQDSAGDRIFGADSLGPQGYVFEIVGGTGKYAGITGTGVVESLPRVKRIREGTMQACRHAKGSYKLP
ncbi:MAG: hypothetical protein IH627_10395 [Rubrivivax sp.]|nr:hypothetical protein [Rubrivivax sp.]